MGHLWIPDIGIGEKIIRSVVVYLFLLVVLRIAGKRQVAQMTTFDLVVLLMIANVVQNAVIGPDNSLSGGLIGASGILLLNAIVARGAYRFKGVRRVLEGEPTLLVHNGEILKGHLAHERVSLAELQEAMREHGLADLAHVRYAVLEQDGTISILARQEPPRPAPPTTKP